MPNDSFAKIQETKSSKETNTLFSRIFSFADTDSLINLTSTNKALKNEVEKKKLLFSSYCSIKLSSNTPHFLKMNQEAASKTYENTQVA